MAATTRQCLLTLRWPAGGHDGVAEGAHAIRQACRVLDRRRAGWVSVAGDRDGAFDLASDASGRQATGLRLVAVSSARPRLVDALTSVSRGRVDPTSNRRAPKHGPHDDGDGDGAADDDQPARPAPTRANDPGDRRP
jgi:hypothetical protein